MAATDYIAATGDLVVEGTSFKDIVKKFERTNNPQYTASEERTLNRIIAGFTPPGEGEQWRVTAVDDYGKAASATGLRKELLDAYAAETLIDVESYPAGNSSGNLEKDMANVRVLWVGEVVMDSEATTLATFEAMLHVSPDDVTDSVIT